MDKREFKRILDAQRMEMHAAANNLEWAIIDRMRHQVQSQKIEHRNSRERMLAKALASGGDRFTTGVVQ